MGEGEDKLSMEVWRLVDNRMVLGGLGFIRVGLNTGQSSLLVLLIKPKISQELLGLSGARGVTLGQNKGRFEAADLEDFMD